MSQAYLHSDNMEDVRERLENTITQSSVETMYDGEDCFITVTQRNETTGNESKWSFCVDFGDFRITMLEPTEDIEYFGSDNEIFGIIKNFINGGMSREKRFGNKIGSSKKPIKSSKTICRKGSAKLIEHCEAGDCGYLGRYTIIINGKEVFNFTAENRREAVCSFNNYLDHKMNNYINNSRKPIKSSLSDVNKALGFTDNDIKEDGKIHITTDLGEFVVDYVNDEYIVSYDGEERTFTDYKDTVEEVVNLFNQLCNEEVEFFNKNINSSKPIKSSHDRETLEKVIRAYLNDRGYKDVKGGIGAAADYIWQNEDYYTDYDLHSKVKQWFKETLENYPETLIKASRTIKSDYSDEEYWYPEEDNEYVVQIINRKYEEPYYSYITETNRWDGNLEDAKLFTYENAMKEREEMQHFFAEDGLNVNYWVSVKKLSDIKSSHKPIKSDFNPYYEKHPDTFVAYLVGDEDSITQEDIDKAEKEWYKLMYAGYGSLYGETGHLFLGPYENVKSYVEDYLGVGLLDDYLYTYNKDDSVLDHFETQPDKPLPTEKDYQDFVNQLNKYVAENYETHGNYGPIYMFNMYKGEGTNSDGYGHEYPNFIIYDDEGNLDMHSDDDITEYIRNELKAKGWYPEAVHSSSDFTIAVM